MSATAIWVNAIVLRKEMTAKMCGEMLAISLLCTLSASAAGNEKLSPSSPRMSKSQLFGLWNDGKLLKWWWRRSYETLRSFLVYFWLQPTKTLICYCQDIVKTDGSTSNVLNFGGIAKTRPCLSLSLHAHGSGGNCAVQPPSIFWVFSFSSVFVSKNYWWLFGCKQPSTGPWQFA